MRKTSHELNNHLPHPYRNVLFLYLSYIGIYCPLQLKETITHLRISLYQLNKSFLIHSLQVSSSSCRASTATLASTCAREPTTCRHRRCVYIYTFYVCLYTLFTRACTASRERSGIRNCARAKVERQTHVSGKKRIRHADGFSSHASRYILLSNGEECEISRFIFYARWEDVSGSKFLLINCYIMSV